MKIRKQLLHCRVGYGLVERLVKMEQVVNRYVNEVSLGRAVVGAFSSWCSACALDIVAVEDAAARAVAAVDDFLKESQKPVIQL